MKPHCLTGTILLISHDDGFQQALRDSANSRGSMLIQTRSLAGAVVSLSALKPCAVILDLDLPGQLAWRMADVLLADQSCPPMVLVSRDKSPDDNAVAGGVAVACKTASPSLLLELVDKHLHDHGSIDEERTAVLDRILVHRIGPGSSARPVALTHRFWGINE